MERFVSLFGLLAMMGFAWVLSNNKRKMPWRLIITGLLMQFVIGVLILQTPGGERVFQWMNDLVSNFIAYSNQGAAFVFGDRLVGTGQWAGKEGGMWGLAFFVLPTIIFVSSVMSVLFHLGVMQWVVKGMARLMVWIMDVSGAESLAASANVFVGHTEAPLVIRPYLKTMTPSELMAMLTGGMATIAGGVLAAYAGFVTNAGMAGGAGHLLTASFMSAPASLVIAKIMFPETLESPTKATVKIDVASEATNVIDAACRGAGDGLRLALNVGAMLIAFVAIIFMLNGLLAAFCTQVLGVPAISFQQILGYVMAPFAWLMGVPWDDCLRAGQLLGTKTVLNEFIAYLELARMIKAEEISPRGAVILTYALCGFANFGSIAVQIGGIGDLVPERRADIAKLGIKAMIGGTLAAFMTATVAGVLITTPDAWPVKP